MKKRLWRNLIMLLLVIVFFVIIFFLWVYYPSWIPDCLLKNMEKDEMSNGGAVALFTAFAFAGTLCLLLLQLKMEIRNKRQHELQSYEDAFNLQISQFEERLMKIEFKLDSTNTDQYFVYEGDAALKKMRECFESENSPLMDSLFERESIVVNELAQRNNDILDKIYRDKMINDCIIFLYIWRNSNLKNFMRYFFSIINEVEKNIRLSNYEREQHISRIKANLSEEISLMVLVYAIYYLNIRKDKTPITFVLKYNLFSNLLLDDYLPKNVRSYYKSELFAAT